MSKDLLRLDELIKRRLRPHRTASSSRVVVVFGGKGGVGTSVVASTLAYAATRERHEVLLIENFEALATLHHHLGIERGLGISALRSGKCTPHDLAVEVTKGLRLISSDRGDGNELPPQSPSERHFLQMRLRSLYPEVDLVLIDGGSTVSSIGSITASRPGLFIAVTNPTRMSVISTYALIKALLQFSPSAPVELLVNRATPDEAYLVHRELSAAVANFLGIGLNLAGSLPEIREIAESAREGSALVEAIQESDALGAVSDICGRIMHHISQGTTSSESSVPSFQKRG